MALPLAAKERFSSFVRMTWMLNPHGDVIDSRVLMLLGRTGGGRRGCSGLPGQGGLRAGPGGTGWHGLVVGLESYRDARLNLRCARNDTLVLRRVMTDPGSV